MAWHTYSSRVQFVPITYQSSISSQFWFGLFFSLLKRRRTVYRGSIHGRQYSLGRALASACSRPPTPRRGRALHYLYELKVPVRCYGHKSIQKCIIYINENKNSSEQFIKHCSIMTEANKLYWFHELKRYVWSFLCQCKILSNGHSRTTMLHGRMLQYTSYQHCLRHCSILQKNLKYSIGAAYFTNPLL
jgi:hypothetical protein